MAACLERAADPYRASADWKVAALAAPSGAWAGLRAFYRRYPMVRHMVEVTTENYQQNIQRCCERLTEDWPDLETFFFNGTTLAALTGIKTTGSDFHKGGGQVLILQFRDAALRDRFLVYKPSDVERDLRVVGDTQALTNALANLRVVTHKGVTQANLLNNANGSLGELITQQAAVGHLSYTVPVYRILPVWPGSGLAVAGDGVPIRKSYGYLEFLSNEPADNRFLNPDQRQAYYKSLGAQVATCWVFQVTALHQGNLIVHARMPYLIDLEVAYTGIMALPQKTNLRSAYGTFKAPNQQRMVMGWVGNKLYYEIFEHLSTKNALYDVIGTLVPPDPNDRAQMVQAFVNTVGLVIYHFDVYDAWLVAAQNMVTRILPFGTDVLLLQVQEFNGQDVPGSAVTFPDQIDMKTRDNGSGQLAGWGDQFNAAANPPSGMLSASQLNLVYSEIAPKFAFWFERQTATDFKSGDVPAFYQKMNTPHALGSQGRFIEVEYGAGVQRAMAVNQQPLANALVTLWGTAAPVLPSSYFTSNVVQIQRDYLNALQLNTANFTTLRLAAATNDMSMW